MRIEIVKGRDHDRIGVTRDDGSRAETTFPHKGPVPHDAVHWFVERELGLASAFWGTVAGGLHPEAIQEIAKAAGHPSAKRAGLPEAGIIELLKAERIVECFEADLWGGGGAAADLIAIADTACTASHVARPAALDEVAVERIRQGAGRLCERVDRGAARACRGADVGVRRWIR
ncbi:MAG TPA: hypothetical protein PKN09_10380 [Novosphingobium sp.]|nr:hypothetical protein [Novosphingobium sp.]